MKQHHFFFIALSVICILIIPKQTFAQEVLTKVNGGASWETSPTTDGNGIYDGNGSLSTNTEVSMGANNLLFSSTGGNFSIDCVANTFIVNESNRSLILSNSVATAKLHVGGSISHAIAQFDATSSNSYTMGENDYLLFANTANSDADINLPDPATCIGRVYRFVKTSGSNSLIFNRNIQMSPTVNTSTFSGCVITLTIISNETNWWKL